MNLGIQITHLRKKRKKRNEREKGDEKERKKGERVGVKKFQVHFDTSSEIFHIQLYYTHNLTSITLRKILCILQKNTKQTDWKRVRLAEKKGGWYIRFQVLSRKG